MTERTGAPIRDLVKQAESLSSDSRDLLVSAFIMHARLGLFMLTLLMTVGVIGSIAWFLLQL